MKKLMIAFDALVLLTGSVYAANGSHWEASLFGDKDGAGINAFPGNTFDWQLLPTYLPAVDGDDFTDKWVCGEGGGPDDSCWMEWPQD